MKPWFSRCCRRPWLYLIVFCLSWAIAACDGFNLGTNPCDRPDPSPYCTFKTVEQINALPAARSVIVSPDGTLLLSDYSDDSTIGIWNLTAHQRQTVLKGHSQPLRAVALSPDGKTLVSGGLDTTVRVWDVATGQLQRTLTGHTDMVAAIAITPDGKTIISGGLDHTLRFWDLATGNPFYTTPAHEISTLAIAPDGKTLATGGFDHQVRLWNLPSGTLRSRLPDHWTSLHSVAFSPDGRWLVSGSHKQIKVWDLQTQQVQTSVGSYPMTDLEISPDSQHVIVGAGDEGIKIWNLLTGRYEAQLIPAGQDWVSAIATSPDGTSLFSVTIQGIDRWQRH